MVCGMSIPQLSVFAKQDERYVWRVLDVGSGAAREVATFDEWPQPYHVHVAPNRSEAFVKMVGLKQLVRVNLREPERQLPLPELKHEGILAAGYDDDSTPLCFFADSKNLERRGDGTSAAYVYDGELFPLNAEWDRGGVSAVLASVYAWNSQGFTLLERKVIYQRWFGQLEQLDSAKRLIRVEFLGNVRHEETKLKNPTELGEKNEPDEYLRWYVGGEGGGKLAYRAYMETPPLATPILVHTARGWVRLPGLENVPYTSAHLVAHVQGDYLLLVSAAGHAGRLYDMRSAELVWQSDETTRSCFFSWGKD